MLQINECRKVWMEKSMMHEGVKNYTGIVQGCIRPNISKASLSGQPKMRDIELT